MTGFYPASFFVGSAGGLIPVPSPTPTPTPTPTPQPAPVVITPGSISLGFRDPFNPTIDAIHFEAPGLPAAFAELFVIAGDSADATKPVKVIPAGQSLNGGFAFNHGNRTLSYLVRFIDDSDPPVVLLESNVIQGHGPRPQTS